MKTILSRASLLRKHQSVAQRAFATIPNMKPDDKLFPNAHATNQSMAQLTRWFANLDAGPDTATKWLEGLVSSNVQIDIPELKANGLEECKEIISNKLRGIQFAHHMSEDQTLKVGIDKTGKIVVEAIAYQHQEDSHGQVTGERQQFQAVFEHPEDDSAPFHLPLMTHLQVKSLGAVEPSCLIPSLQDNRARAFLHTYYSLIDRNDGDGTPFRNLFVSEGLSIKKKAEGDMHYPPITSWRSWSEAYEAVPEYISQSAHNQLFFNFFPASDTVYHVDSGWEFVYVDAEIPDSVQHLELTENWVLNDELDDNGRPLEILPRLKTQVSGVHDPTPSQDQDEDVF